MARVRNKEDISGFRRSWAFLGVVKLSAWPGQERQLSMWLEVNLEGNWESKGNVRYHR